MIDWLKKRLSPVKIDNSRWEELAEAIQEFFATHFDPSYENLANARSIYTASSEDQLKIIRELGGYFEDDMPEENRPVLVAQRKLELMQKETDVPLKSILRRLGISVTWQPLYMLPDGTYGEAFYTEDQLSTHGVTAAECLLTSRGCLVIDISDAPVSEDTANLAIRRCRDILPLHIVFDKCRLYALTHVINMPTILIGALSSETVVVYPYMQQTIEVLTTNTRCGGGTLIYETVEVRPQE